MAITLGMLEPLLDIARDEDGSWSVSVKAMPGHVGAAMSLREAVAESADAAEAWVEALQDRPDLGAALEYHNLRRGYAADISATNPHYAAEYRLLLQYYGLGVGASANDIINAALDERRTV